MFSRQRTRVKFTLITLFVFAAYLGLAVGSARLLGAFDLAWRDWTRTISIAVEAVLLCLFLGGGIACLQRLRFQNVLVEIAVRITATLITALLLFACIGFLAIYGAMAVVISTDKEYVTTTQFDTNHNNFAVLQIWC